VGEAPRAVLESNLSALALHDASLASAVRAAAPDPRLASMTARNGALIPAILLPHGTLPLHSLYDPLRESRRLAESVRGSGCYVLFGLGAGFHASALLEDPGVFSLIVIEKDASVLRSLLACIPLQHLLEDPRIHVVPGLDAIPAALRAYWQPSLMGGLRTLSLRPWCECELTFFARAAEGVQSGIADIRADHSVQAHFAKRWCANILLNMAIAERGSPRLPRGDRAFVTAAGPSLDGQMGGIARARSSSLLIATDTSLPALLGSGLTPDAVVSIDCQSHGYQHFFRGLPDTTALFCDLASPASITRRGRSVAFMAGAHPLVSYLCARWRALPRIDMSGGNVTHAALCLAQSLGARRITLCGADFSYPRGAMYARGTYVHDLFMASQGRLRPVESQWLTFLLRAPDTLRESREGRVLYTTPLLTSYRDRLLRLMRTMDAVVVPDEGGEGLPLAYQREPRSDSPPAAGADAVPPPPAEPVCGWREALDAYARDLDGLSVAENGGGAWFRSLSSARIEVLATLLPVTACVLGEGDARRSRGSAIEEARRWTLNRVRRALNGPVR
jgi:hypothetical protein